LETLPTGQVSKPEISQIKKGKIQKSNSTSAILGHVDDLSANPVQQIKSNKVSSLIRIRKDEENKGIESHSQMLLSQVIKTILNQPCPKVALLGVLGPQI
jgi:hypothetical protein